MKIEASIAAPPDIQELARHARELEQLGFDGILVPEAGHDPYLPQMILAEHTQRCRIGTGVAISFPRSPFVTAQMAWDLQRFSAGRFSWVWVPRLRATMCVVTQRPGHHLRGRVYESMCSA